MCLGVPGRVLEIDGFLALVDFFGVQRQVRLEVIDEPVEPGDYVLNHVGFAIRRIPHEEIDETLAMYRELISGTGTDLMAQDVRAEIDAAGGRS
jgi:hydrogenase expression/formation protein HypC